MHTANPTQKHQTWNIMKERSIVKIRYPNFILWLGHKHSLQYTCLSQEKKLRSLNIMENYNTKNSCKMQGFYWVSEKLSRIKSYSVIFAKDFRFGKFYNAYKFIKFWFSQIGIFSCFAWDHRKIINISSANMFKSRKNHFLKHIKGNQNTQIILKIIQGRTYIIKCQRLIYLVGGCLLWNFLG